MSVKDNLKWNNLSQKLYTHMLMNVGRFMAMSDEDFKKTKLEHDKMSSDEIASILIAAFGDGK